MAYPTDNFDAFGSGDAQAIAAKRLAKQQEPIGPSTSDRAAGAGKGALSGAASGASLGSLGGPYGTAIGAVAGGIIGGVGGAMTANPSGDTVKDAETLKSAMAKKKFDPNALNDEALPPGHDGYVAPSGGVSGSLGDGMDAVGDFELGGEFA